MSDSNVVFVPARKAPYNGLRSDKKGFHFRTYTIAAGIYSGLIVWDSKEGKVKGYSKGNPDLFAAMIGTSAGGYWKANGRFANGEFTSEGRAVIDKSISGNAAGGYNANIPGLITAYVRAFDTGTLSEPGTGNALERWNAKLDRSEYGEPAKAPAKAPQKAAAPAKAATPSKAPAKAAKAPSKAQKAPAKAAPVLITPRAK